jgi:hypothetical protein
VKSLMIKLGGFFKHTDPDKIIEGPNYNANRIHAYTHIMKTRLLTILRFSSTIRRPKIQMKHLRMIRKASNHNDEVAANMRKIHDRQNEEARMSKYKIQETKRELQFPSHVHKKSKANAPEPTEEHVPQPSEPS